MTTFAKGLVSGTIKAPPRTSWWPRHSRAIMQYLAVAESQVAVNLRHDLCECIAAEAREFESLCPLAARHGLMIEHVGLELSLVDAARKGDVGAIDGIGKKLFENTNEMAAVLGIAIAEFPEEQFHRLLSDHVALFAGSVRKKVEGVVVTHSKIESNTLQLADFTAEWL